MLSGHVQFFLVIRLVTLQLQHTQLWIWRAEILSETGPARVGSSGSVRLIYCLDYPPIIKSREINYCYNHADMILTVI